MTDVRLTATNPEDSSVVPVACNAKGELKLEEVPTFDGNVDGDLTVAGDVSTRTVFATGAGLVTAAAVSGATTDAFPDGTNQYYFLGKTDGDPNTVAAAKFAVTAKGTIYTDSAVVVGNNAAFINSNGSIFCNRSVSSNGLWYGQINGDTTSLILADGSATFAGNKAGFTAEGYLWCTTRRGDTVILDFTSNGIATWAPYTPPTRLTEIQDRWSEKDGILPVPHESSQDEPKTPQ